ncbi:hypothetical protein GCM10009347_07930 [Shewanella algicola]|uniref:Uncharacterized protein n=1 Tax=Shewanella algicola TaxID=640633 RepID=A0A9X2CBA0_9GAMM|nr:hypothetical protein [Shewanella algicola]MCL1104363.1 hypothetical protein [Shewanella algicola]GGP42625.1 hypothetical protein GCM10009347_07930 [Shewanella algicola]
MSNVIKYLLLGALVCLALVCYSVGSATGAVAFITMGVLLEIAFWLGIIKSTRARRQS